MLRERPPPPLGPSSTKGPAPGPVPGGPGFAKAGRAGSRVDSDAQRTAPACDKLRGAGAPSAEVNRLNLHPFLWLLWQPYSFIRPRLQRTASPRSGLRKPPKTSRNRPEAARVYEDLQSVRARARQALHDGGVEPRRACESGGNRYCALRRSWEDAEHGCVPDNLEARECSNNVGEAHA